MRYRRLIRLLTLILPLALSSVPAHASHSITSIPYQSSGYTLGDPFNTSWDIGLFLSTNSFGMAGNSAYIQYSPTAASTSGCTGGMGGSTPNVVLRSCPATTPSTPGTYSVYVHDGDGHNSNTVAYTVYTPAPSLTSLSPSSITAGSTAFTLTITGSNFWSGAVVQWDGVALPTSYVNSAQITASIDAARIASPGTHSIAVANLAPTRGSSNTLTFTVNNPAPVLSTITPSSTTAPGVALTLTVNGSSFISSSTVNWNGGPLTTTYASATQLTASIPASSVATGGTATITVFNPSPGGGTSTGQTFTINNPLPVLSAISPSSATPNSAALTLTVNGSSFISSSTVNWNGGPLTTTYASATQLTASIPASNVATAGTATVTVVNGIPGGGTSNGQTFTINYPTPTLSSISPSSIPMGNDTLTVTAAGTGFYAGVSTIQWNGTNLTTTYVSPTQLTAVIPAANLVGPDTVNLTIFTGGPGGGASNAKAFTIFPALTIGPLTQDGWNVTAAVIWPTASALTNQVVNCGTTTAQTFTGPTGTCVYAKAGAFTISGTSTVGGAPNVQAPSQTVAIPLIVPTTATLSATVNGLQPAANGAIAPFHFPASLEGAITLVRPAGIGIVDALDRTVSRLAITPEGGATSNRFIQAGTDVLHLTATEQLNVAVTYTLQLNGQMESGAPITGSLTLIVTQGSPTLIFGNLVQDGFDVLMTVSWPDNLQSAVPISINCGTPNAQLLTATTGVCRYTAAGVFEVRGNFRSLETGTPVLQTTPQPATIPLRIPTGADLIFEVNTVPATGAAITAYRFPALVKSTVALRLPAQIGVIDQLDVGPSRLNIGRTGGGATAYRLSLGTNQMFVTSLSSFDAPGEYTITLAGQTVHGTAIAATQTLTVTAANVSLILGSLAQDGEQIAISVTWPDGITPIAVTCGTPSLQTFTGPAGACSYDRPGSFEVSGSFRNPEDNTSFAATPTMVTIPAITPVNPQIALQVNSQPTGQTGSAQYDVESHANGVLGDIVKEPGELLAVDVTKRSSDNSASTYRVPALLKATVTMQRPAGIGVLDRLDTQNSTISVIPEGMAPTRYRPVVRENPLLAVTNGEIRRAGAHTIAFEGKTLTGRTLSATVPLTLELGKATLETDPPAQDGNAVIVRVRWPAGGPTGTINCGFMSQTLTATGGACRYTQAGSYQIIGFFSDPARGSTVLTDPIPVTIPLLAPTHASLSVVSMNSAGVSSDTTGQIPLFTTMQPQSYPVGVRLRVTFTRPDGIGVLDVIDRSRSSLTATAVGGNAIPILVGMSFGSSPLELTALASLRSFSPDPTDPSRWRYQFTFTGQALGGSVYSAHAELVGSIGGLPPLTLQVSRAAPSIPYAPAIYQYSLTGAKSATLAEPLTATWTVTPDGQPPGQTVQNNRMMVTFEGPGTYQIQLTVRGPFSGTSTWFDTVTIPALPSAGTPTIAITTPAQNRPPATYRFVAVTPPMPDRRERIGVPTWTVEGATVSTPALVTTFTTAGQHQIGVSLPTSYGRTMEAQTIVTVNSNQPPVGTVDCSRSSYQQRIAKYNIYCRATAADPDGRISKIKWAIPELQYERLDTTIMAMEHAQPMAVTVELHIIDNSNDETVVSIPIDMASLPVQ